MKHILTLVALLSAPLAEVAADEPSVQRSATRAYGERIVSAALKKKIEGLERQLPELMRDHHVLGVSLAFIENRSLVWSRGYGIRCTGTLQLVQPETVMEACSMSKLFFAYLMLKLVERTDMALKRFRFSLLQRVLPGNGRRLRYHD